MTQRPNPMDLRKSQEQLNAEGYVDPGPYPVYGTSAAKQAWVVQYNKSWLPVDDEYREAVQAAMSNV